MRKGEMKFLNALIIARCSKSKCIYSSFIIPAKQYGGGFICIWLIDLRSRAMSQSATETD